MNRPVVGVTAYDERARWNIWDTAATVVQRYYVDGITLAGARAVVLPPDDGDTDVLDRLDGLLLTGGADVAARRYGQVPHPAADPPQELRDRAELALLRGCSERDLPVLGVCRGAQLLALSRGGTLHQHLPDVVGHDGHSPASGEFASHPVTFAGGSLAEAVHGPRGTVNSHHHQSVAQPGAGLVAVGHADDGVIEAVEDPSRRFVLGVQWHPEMAGGDGLFAAFVGACVAAAGSRRG